MRDKTRSASKRTVFHKADEGQNPQCEQENCLS
jgi:hypothetical protein